MPRLLCYHRARVIQAARRAGEHVMNVRRLVVYLILNAVVSAAATLTVLTLWDRAHPAGPSLTDALTFTATPPAAVAANNTSAAPVVEPTAVVLPTPTLYVVKSGDTLGTIAQQFDVSVDDIMAANGLTDPNLLNVGTSLLIPVAGSVPPTAVPGTAAPVATTVVEPPRPTATRDPSVAQPRLTIREVVSAGTLAEEALVIVNNGGPVDLAGWSLRDGTGHSYSFPTLMLFEGGAITVHTAAGTDSVTDLYWGQAEPVWTAGAEVLLSDTGGNLHARYTVP
jgi:LysM repeat protein